MGILEKLGFGRKASDPLALWAEIAKAGRHSKSGATINLDTALRVATWFACVRVISQGCAQVPFKLFRTTEEGGLTKIQPARELKLYDLMATKPNDWQTSFEFREQLAIHAAHGNAYAWKNKTIGGISEMILLDPVRMCVEQPDEFGAAVYKYTLRSGMTILFPADQIWHVRGPSWAGYAGLDVLRLAREALGLAIATEESHAGLHARGVRPTGVYSVDGNLSDEQHKKLTAWLKKEAAENVGGTMILDRAAKWLSTTMSGMDAQHLETRRFQIEEVCRFAGVSPFMVFHTDKAPTYASAEQFQIQHVVHTLSPWYARIEQSADASLLTEKDRAKGLYFKFLAAGLLRGSMKDQGEYFARMLGAGGTRQVLTQDEIRALLEFNPMGGDAAVLHEPTGSKPPDPMPAAAKQQIETLERKLEQLQARPAAPPTFTVNLNQEAITVRHEGGDVNVAAPEVKVAPAAPVVNVQNDIHVPQGPAPSVTNNVNVPKQDPSPVTLEATLPALTVVAQIPARKTHTDTRVTRDKDGNITGSTTDGTEKDA